MRVPLGCRDFTICFEVVDMVSDCSEEVEEVAEEEVVAEDEVAEDEVAEDEVAVVFGVETGLSMAVVVVW